MKLRVTVDLEIPDDAKLEFMGTKYEAAFLSEMIGDNLVRYAQSAHLRDAMKWMVQDPPEGADPDIWSQSSKLIIKVHNAWADILKDSTFTVDVVK